MIKALVAWRVPLLLVLLTILPRLTGLPGTFIYDDVLIVRDNPLVRSSALGKIWTSPYWHDQAGRGLYRPLTVSTFAFNWRLHGETPFWFHLDNLLLHTINVFLLYWLLGSFKIAPTARLFLTLLFSLHPMTIESVQGLVGRAELLTTFFTLIALRLFVRLQVASAAPKINLLGICLCYFAGLLCKESAVVLPLLLGLLWLSLGRQRLVIPGWIIGSAMLAPLGLVFWLRSQVLESQAPQAVVIQVSGFYQHLLVLLQVIGKSVQSLLLPYRWQWDLAPFAMLPAKDLMNAYVLIGLGSIAGVLGLRHWYGNRCYFLLSLPLSAMLTTLHFVPIGVIFAERFLYLPLAMLSLALALFFKRSTSIAVKLSGLKLSNRKVALATGLIASYVVLLMVGHRLWRDELTFWRYTVAQSPKSLSSNLNLASVYQRQGNLPQAEHYLRKNIELAPKTSLAWGRLAEVLFEQKHYQQAHEALEMTLKINPNPNAHNLWGVNQIAMANFEKAGRGFEQALAMAPDNELYAINLALYYAQGYQQKVPGKQEQYRSKALALLQGRRWSDEAKVSVAKITKMLNP